MSNKLPNFFIVGAAKSGTTFLWYNLKNNASVFMPKEIMLKEPAFFSSITGIRDFKEYLKLFSRAHNCYKMIGEASTAYLTDPSSAKNIFDFDNKAKIIISLRNPVDRAFSLYKWMTQEGYEYAPSFKIALKLENKRINKKFLHFIDTQYYYNYLYITSGFYYKQVKRYIDLFGRNNVHIIKFEQLIIDPQPTYNKLCSFLDIKENVINQRPQNRSKGVISPLIQFAARKINNCLVKGLKIKSNTKNSRDFLVNFLQYDKIDRRLSKHLKKQLLVKYTDDINKLSNLTSINFNDWFI